MKLWCFDDAHNWGSMLVAAAKERGIDARLFESPRDPDEGFVFMHMHHHPRVRLYHKRCMAIMAMNPNLTLIPEYRSSLLYDDKIEQARQLARWMPRTFLYYTPGAARRGLDAKMPEYPFVSKASQGASSHNVRFVQTPEEARAEIRAAFSDRGIKLHYSESQSGYLLWQQFIPNNAGDIRIIAIGRKRLVLRRGNRADKPFASGSGKLKPIVDLEDEEVLAALHFSNDFFTAEDFKWCGIDLVKDEKGRWYVLEVTVGWTLHGYYECMFIDCSERQPKLMDRQGFDVWQILLDEIEAGIF